jgi:plasmid stabilization system protein ParE
MYLIKVTEPAEQDIQEAIDYISMNLQNRMAAVRLLDDLEEVISSLKDMPSRHPLVDDESLAEHNIRFCPVQSYLMFYAVREEIQTVVIERFLYGRRNWNTILRGQNKPG